MGLIGARFAAWDGQAILVVVGKRLIGGGSEEPAPRSRDFAERKAARAAKAAGRRGGPPSIVLA